MSVSSRIFFLLDQAFAVSNGMNCIEKVCVFSSSSVGNDIGFIVIV